MSKILFVIPPEDFRDEEYFIPQRVFTEQGFTTDTASLSKGLIRGAGGKKTEARFLVSEVNPSEYEAVVFVGGPGMVDLVAEKELVSFAQKFFQAQKVVAGICAACAVLANAGLLKGLSATCWDGVRDVLVKRGANLTPKPVVWSGRVITANGPLAAKEFAETVVKALSES
ncbi:DJ-1/PfpI family protein [bacterium]|nr:DJ-1/PfpI family protein [bacterium]